MKIQSAAASSPLAFALVLGAAFPSFAADLSTDSASSTLQSTGAGGTNAVENPATFTELQKAGKKQSIQDVAAVIESAYANNPVSALMNDSGESVAAIATPSTGFSIFAITPVGPGYASTSACIYPYNGYQGTGVLAINVSGSKVFAGDRSMTFWVGNTGNFAAAYVTLNFTSARTFTSVSRS